MTTKKEYYDFCKKEKGSIINELRSKVISWWPITEIEVFYKLIDSIYDHYIDKAETPDFDAFRSKYPVKKWKWKAKPKYLSIIKSWVSHETIMKWLQNYIDSMVKWKQDKTYIKHPLTRLTWQHWEDEYEVRLTTFVKKKVRVPEEKKEVTDKEWVKERLQKARDLILSKSI